MRDARDSCTRQAQFAGDLMLETHQFSTASLQGITELITVKTPYLNLPNSCMDFNRH